MRGLSACDNRLAAVEDLACALWCQLRRPFAAWKESSIAESRRTSAVAGCGARREWLGPMVADGVAVTSTENRRIRLLITGC